MRILVCGGRDFDDWELLHGTLMDYRYPQGGKVPLTIISGNACGADWLARAWANYQSVDSDNPVGFEGYSADWKTHGKRAGHIRNAQMLNEGKPDLVIAFPGGRGTQDMVNKATNAGVPVMEVS